VEKEKGNEGKRTGEGEEGKGDHFRRIVTVAFMRRVQIFLLTYLLTYPVLLDLSFLATPMHDMTLTTSLSGMV